MSDIKNSLGMLTPKVRVFPEPIFRTRIPTAADINFPKGQIWIFQDPAGGSNDMYILSSRAGGTADWINCGGGSGNFDSITVNPNDITIVAGDLDITAGDATIAAGDFEVTAGSVTIGGLAHAGVVVNDAAGLLSTSTGTNGQVLIGATGAGCAWATLTAGAGITITNAANSITIDNPGATGTSITCSDANNVVPDGLGVTEVIGYDANITTDGATANTVKIRLSDNITSVGKITSSVGFEVLAGTTEIISDTNAADAILLYEDGGVNGRIRLYSNQGTAVDSVEMSSNSGGIWIDSGLGAANAITINSTDNNGGIDVDAGSFGINMAIANGPFALTTGTGALQIGADATVKDITIGSNTGAAGLDLACGTGDFTLVSGDAVTIDAVGVLELNSSTGIISIGNDAIAQNINIGTGAAARTLTIGNASAATSVVVNSGTGNADFAYNNTDHSSRIGSATGVSATTLRSGTGALTVVGLGDLTIDAASSLELNASAGAISIGNDAVAANMNIGTGGAARIIIIGNATAATQVVLNAGTAGVEIGTNAIAHPVNIGTLTGAGATTVQCGTGALTINGGGDVTIDSVGAMDINSSGAAIRIGNDAVAQDISIGAGAAARAIGIGNNTTTTSFTVTVGTGTCTIANNATEHDTILAGATGTSSTSLYAGTGGLIIDGTGTIDIDGGDALGINSDGGAISIGNDADDFAVNIGTAGTRTITIGNNTATTAVDLVAGSGNVSVNSDLEFGTAAKGIVFQAGPKVIAGAGTPHGSITAPQGSLYLRTNGTTTNDRLYINTDSGTTWTAITTAA